MGPAERRKVFADHNTKEEEHRKRSASVERMKEFAGRSRPAGARRRPFAAADKGTVGRRSSLAAEAQHSSRQPEWRMKRPASKLVPMPEKCTASMTPEVRPAKCTASMMPAVQPEKNTASMKPEVRPAECTASRKPAEEPHT